MPNPRYIKDEKPTEELEFKLKMAHYVYFSGLEPFCKSFGFEHEIENLKNIQGVYLIGSHANDSGWSNETSDIDFKLFIPDAMQEAFNQYKRTFLDNKLLAGEKPNWIDLYGVNAKHRIDPPYVDLTSLWNSFRIEN